MNPTVDACLRSWPYDPWLLATCLLLAGVYLRGWLVLHRRDAPHWQGGRLAAFVAAVAAIYLALASPIEPLASLLLQLHMVQHLLLMMVAPPLLWLSAPVFPLLRGLPRSVRDFWFAPILSSRWLRGLAARLTHPGAALAVFTGVTWLWHLPPAYELALRSERWHYVQHACFLLAGMLFWYPVVRPYPTKPRWSRWLLVPYLILGDIQNTLLSAWLTFSSTPVYPHYAGVPRLGNISPVDDQSAAGVIMWVPGSVLFLGPLFAIALRLLYGDAGTQARPPRARVLKSTDPRFRPARAGFRALRSALLGTLHAFLRWRHARTALQLPLLLAAGAIVYDGLAGPQASPLNLAGVLPWIHWRGLVVFGLVAVGNVACMACPFTLPRRLAGRWLPRSYTWPHWLRSKWLAVALVVLFLWAYEAFALWDSPWLTAWITIAYFTAALAIDGLFRGSAFCKYVCPIGQFNFVQSLVSPLEIGVRHYQVCTACRTKDCIRGRAELPGCELELFQPRKSGNMDCTFCLDCVRVCPQENVGLIASPPGSQLWHDRLRWGGRLSARADIAALVAVLVFGAFANAAGMVAPVVDWRNRIATEFDASPTVIVAFYSVLTIVVAPLAAMIAAGVVCLYWAKLPSSLTRTVTRYSFALVPIGFGMWLAHYGFHLFTSYQSVVPTSQRFAADFGMALLGEPRWSCACCVPAAGWLIRGELLFLDLGFLLSQYTAYRLSAVKGLPPGRVAKALFPWSLLIAALFALGVWIVFQPMQMRGTMTAGG